RPLLFRACSSCRSGETHLISSSDEPSLYFLYSMRVSVPWESQGLCHPESFWRFERPDLKLCLAEFRVRFRVQRRHTGGSRWKMRSEEHTSELQSRFDLVCRLLLEKKTNTATPI